MGVARGALSRSRALDPHAPSLRRMPQSASSSVDPVRVVVLGNSFASKAQLPALRWAGGNEVVAIAGADGAKARQTADAWGIERDTDAWQSALEEPCDLVLVTTPVHLHAPMVRATLEGTQAAVLCEKPFALDAGEAQQLAKLGAGRLCLLDHQLRWSPWRRTLRSLVRDGYLGELWHGRVEMSFGPTPNDRPYGWWYDSQRGGGILGAIGSHLLDGLQRDLGPVASVRARLATYVPERTDTDGTPRAVTADEHATLWLRMANGGEIEVEANCMATGGFRSSVEYVGSAGALRLEGETRLLGAPHGRELVPLAIEGDAPPTPEELGTPDRGIFQRVLPLYLRDVVSAVKQGAKELDGAATFVDGVDTMRVIDAARRSAASGGWEAPA